MRGIKLILFFIGFSVCINAWAQLSTNEKPVSFGRESELREVHKNANCFIVTKQLDMDKIRKEDAENSRKISPTRFGYKYDVSYNLANSGTWYELSNGDKIWILEVVCPDALSVSFCYDKFWIPEGGKFFVYSKDKNYKLGAFTSRNNKGDRDCPRGFATGLVYGCNVVLEYCQPKDAYPDAIISIRNIIHGYKYVNVNGNSSRGVCDCMVDINCMEGVNWQKEKNAIAKIVVGNEFSSGYLVNTTDVNHRPLFMTANHCISDHGDAVGDSILDDYLFYWNYEAMGCNSSENGIMDTYITNGATILSNNMASDFALLQLTEDPFAIEGYTPYYLGWDYSGQVGEPGVCIHHPNGDVKKISTVLRRPTSSFYSWEPQFQDSHWEVEWKKTQNGYSVVIPGSSGSPLLNADHKVVGQLHASDADCGLWMGHSSWFGKFDVSWTGNNNDSIQRRLSKWLDPIDSGFQIWEGLYILSSDSTMNSDEQICNNLCIPNTKQLTINSHVELAGNNRIIVDAGGMLFINGGTLYNADIVLKSGALLRISHDGVIKTRKGLKVPQGAIVDIKSGKII